MLETPKAYITKVIGKLINWPREHLGKVTIYKMTTIISLKWTISSEDSKTFK